MYGGHMQHCSHQRQRLLNLFSLLEVIPARREIPHHLVCHDEFLLHMARCTYDILTTVTP